MHINKSINKIIPKSLRNPLDIIYCEKSYLYELKKDAWEVQKDYANVR